MDEAGTIEPGQSRRDPAQEHSGYPRQAYQHVAPVAPPVHVAPETLNVLARRWDALQGDGGWRHVLVLLHDLGLIGGVTEDDVRTIVNRKHFSE